MGGGWKSSAGYRLQGLDVSDLMQKHSSKKNGEEE